MGQGQKPWRYMRGPTLVVRKLYLKRQWGRVGGKGLPLMRDSVPGGRLPEVRCRTDGCVGDLPGPGHKA